MSYETAGDAISGTDYLEIGNIIIPAGESSVTITLTPIDDEELEEDETVVVNLVDNTHCELGEDSSAQISIADNDCNEIYGESGGQTVTGTSQPDCFIYNSLYDGGDIIANFTNSEDKIDLSGVLSQIGYSGSNPIADSYLLFQAFGSHTIVQLDIDGSATRGVPRGFLLVQDITPAALNNLKNFII